MTYSALPRRLLKAYALINTNLPCPPQCTYCETITTHVLLPEERSAIFQESRLGTLSMEGKTTVIMKDCCFYNKGRCADRGSRLLDCRSYPAIPSKRGGVLSIDLDSNCPLVQDSAIPDSFLLSAFDAWKIADPADWWLELYNSII